MSDIENFANMKVCDLRKYCKENGIKGISGLKKQNIIDTINNVKISGSLSPIIKWSGGKKDEIKKFIEYIPEKYDTYLEPFIGGGAVYFHLNPNKAVINDLHNELIDFYSSIKKGFSNEIYTFMCEHPNEEEIYYQVRSYKPTTALENAQRFYYLRKTCFRGMLRYNSSGEFNIPYGRYKNFNFEDIKNEISPYLGQLSKIWDSIIYGKGVNFEREKEARNQGDINITRTIKYFPDILSGRMNDVKVMDKKVVKELPSDKPEVIRVRFVGDASGSMDDEMGVKHDVLEKVYVLIMSSLRDFETKLNRTRSQTKSKLSVQTQGWLFGDEAHKIKDFRKGQDYQNEYVKTIQQFELLRRDFGWTYDNRVYEKILEESNAKDRADVKSGKIMDLILEVTDGASSNENGTIDAVSKVEKNGAIVRAFQIGDTNEGEKESFNRVWNNDKKTKGYVVGSEVENLIPAITDALKEYMRGVKI